VAIVGDLDPALSIWYVCERYVGHHRGFQDFARWRLHSQTPDKFVACMWASIKSHLTYIILGEYSVPAFTVGLRQTGILACPTKRYFYVQKK
jgi:hypothetical protein